MKLEKLNKNLIIQQRYEYIRNVYRLLNKDINKCMGILQVSKNALYNANSNLNPQPRIYDHKLQEEHKIFIHSDTIIFVFIFIGNIIKGRTPDN